MQLWFVELNTTIMLQYTVQNGQNHVATDISYVGSQILKTKGPRRNKSLSIPESSITKTLKLRLMYFS